MSVATTGAHYMVILRKDVFQMYSLAWVGLKMPDIFRYAFHSESIPPNGANRGRFIDAQVDSIIETAELEPSVEKQAAYYRELQKVLFDALPLCSIMVRG